MGRPVTERADAIPLLADVFREHGYEGASLALLSRATGLGKGSLYNFFPDGKQGMAAAVLADIHGWFEAEIFHPLAAAADPGAALDATTAAVTRYFRSGQRVCLVGVLAMSAARDPFSAEIAGYFQRWMEALRDCLVRGGVAASLAQALAEDAVSGIQGAIVLSQALDDPAVFRRVSGTIHGRLTSALATARG